MIGAPTRVSSALPTIPPSPPLVDETRRLIPFSHLAEGASFYSNFRRIGTYSANAKCRRAQAAWMLNQRISECSSLKMFGSPPAQAFTAYIWYRTSPLIDGFGSITPPIFQNTSGVKPISSCSSRTRASSSASPVSTCPPGKLQQTLLYEVPVALYAVVVRCSFAKQSCGSAGGKELGPYGHR